MKMNQKADSPDLVVNPFVIYIGMGLMAALLQLLLPLPFVSTLVARIMGVVIMLVNLIIGLPAVRGMLKAKTSPNPNRPTSALVLSGPYRFTRNPMYIGLTLLFAGLMAFFRLPWGLLFTPVVAWLITAWVIRPEEAYLERKFGGEYLKYKETVRRWI
jgi:protein-S-isoprenylcysteine O-methyltransferase Ste14